MAFRRIPPPPRRGGRPVTLRRLPPTPTQPSAGKQEDFNAPLHTFKAFAIATAIVMSTATASVVGVMAYLDIHNMTEFSARMRTWVSQSMPLLRARIYRRPTPRDSVRGDPILLAPQHASSTTFDHDAAQRRLAEAFDKGGLDAWAEVAAREMEAEMEVERARKRTT